MRKKDISPNNEPLVSFFRQSMPLFLDEHCLEQSTAIASQRKNKIE